MCLLCRELNFLEATVMTEYSYSDCVLDCIEQLI